MQVLKFGGTSVANAENINKVISILQQLLQQPVRRPAPACIVVLSALGGITDILISAGKPPPQETKAIKTNLP